MATKTFEELKQLAIQIRDEKTNKQNTATRVGTAMLEHINKLEQDYYDKTTINNRTSEYNVSINHPTSGISSSNKYDLSSAIAQVPAELRTAGLTVSFLNESGDIEKWEFSGGSWAVSSFEQVGAGKLTELNSQVYTKNFSANKVIRKLFIDISGYTGVLSLDGLRISIIARNQGGLWGIQLHNSSSQAIASFWMESELNIQSDFQNGIYLYAEYNWLNMQEGQLQGSPFELTNEVFNNANDPRDAKSSFTTNFNANKVIVKLFIDTSEYTGSLSLDGLNIKILARDVGSLWGIQLGNQSKQTVISAWMNTEQNVQSTYTDGIYLYAEYKWDNMGNGQLQGSPFQLTNEVFNKANDPRESIKKDMLSKDINVSATTTLTNGMYGQAGDSISEGAGLDELLKDSDPYIPISGTKKATYGYYIAKLNNMKWANYGISGSTLGHVVINGSEKNGFSKENGRYTQMNNNLTHISIFFGWNDAAYGPVMKKEEWLQDTYSKKIYYPMSAGLIGKTAEDGTPYASQEQYEAVNKVTGRVGEIDYDNNDEYFKALYVGTKDDATNKTFWGSWNIVLPYLIEKYPLAKILIIVPFGCYALLRQCVRDAAKKYGLATYDFSDINNQMFRQWEDNPADGMINGKTISQYRIDKLTSDGLHPNENGYKYMYPSINAKLLSL